MLHQMQFKLKLTLAWINLAVNLNFNEKNGAMRINVNLPSLSEFQKNWEKNLNKMGQKVVEKLNRIFYKLQSNLALSKL